MDEILLLNKGLFALNIPLNTNEKRANAIIMIKKTERSLIFDKTAIFLFFKFSLRKYNIPFNKKNCF